jgi:uncharacterized protein
MRKILTMKHISNKPPQLTNKKKSKKISLLIGFVILVGFAIWYCFKIYNENKAVKEQSTAIGPSFTKDGNLFFIKKDNQDTLKVIDIEVADNDDKRTQGLMWRHSMPDNVGMLFVFDEETPQSFWMKNTYIPLDIIFTNRNKEIVAIREETTPLSEASIPSVQPAQYVVEVIGGFCYKNNIQVGDKIAFEVTKE